MNFVVVGVTLFDILREEQRRKGDRSRGTPAMEKKIRSGQSCPTFFFLDKRVVRLG
jgi:hypothetical protein